MEIWKKKKWNERSKYEKRQARASFAVNKKTVVARCIEFVLKFSFFSLASHTIRLTQRRKKNQRQRQQQKIRIIFIITGMEMTENNTMWMIYKTERQQ